MMGFFFSLLQRADQFWRPSSLPSNGYSGLLLQGKATGEWSWPLTTI